MKSELMLHYDSLDIQEELSDKYQSLKIITSLVTHDINNAILDISSQIQTLQTGDELYEIINKSIDKIQESITLLQENTKTNFSFYKLLTQILFRIGSDVEVICNFSDVCIFGKPKIFISIISNIIENAKEAYFKKYKTIKGMVLTFKYLEKANVIVIEDNCGGFDIKKIKEGFSSKDRNGHGKFLKTMLENSNSLEVEFAIERIENGTRIFLKFI